MQKYCLAQPFQNTGLIDYATNTYSTINTKPYTLFQSPNNLGCVTYNIDLEVDLCSSFTQSGVQGVLQVFKVPTEKLTVVPQEIRINRIVDTNTFIPNNLNYVVYFKHFLLLGNQNNSKGINTPAGYGKEKICFKYDSSIRLNKNECIGMQIAFLPYNNNPVEEFITVGGICTLSLEYIQADHNKRAIDFYYK